MNTSSMPSQIEAARWDDLVDSLAESIVEIVQTYLEDSPERITEIRQAVAQADYETVQRLAHSMKSSAGIFGAKLLAACCLELEQLARASAPNCETKVDALQSQYDSLARELNERLASLP